MKNLAAYVGIGAIVLVAVSALSSRNPATEVRDPEPQEKTIVEKVAEVVVPTVHAQTGSFTYQDFDQATYEQLRGTEPFSIFFHSKTCGTCAKKDRQIIDEADQFNSGKVLKMEYGEAPTELLKELGVTSYDTFVTFAADGTHTTTLGASVDDVREAIK